MSLNLLLALKDLPDNLLSFRRFEATDPGECHEEGSLLFNTALPECGGDAFELLVHLFNRRLAFFMLDSEQLGRD
jgi:hypothetical protein